MDIIELYSQAESVRNSIGYFNEEYKRQEINTNARWLLPYMREFCEIGLSDDIYWKDTEIDFHILLSKIEDIESKILTQDIVSLYDIIYFEIWEIVRSVFMVLFNKNRSELKEYFWNENIKGLEKYYPEIIERVISNKTQCEFERAYGLRGNVVYSRNENVEYDLYSGYNPMELGMRMEEGLALEKYNKVYMWGFDGGFVINGLINIAQYKYLEMNTEILIAITDLGKFKQILLNTKRDGMFANPNVKLKFDMSIQEFLDEIALYSKESIYVYVCERNGKDFELLRESIIKNSIPNNMKGW